MLRLLFRLFLIAYALLPLVGVVLLISSVRAVQSDLAPVYENASENINDATEDLRAELRQLRSGFQPMVNAVNRLRTAIDDVNDFIVGSVNDVIDWVDDTTFGVFDFPRFGGITLPSVINVNFIDDIADHVDEIGNQVTLVVDTTSSTVTSQLDTLTLAFIVLAVWVVLGPVLMLILVLTGALRL